MKYSGYGPGKKTRARSFVIRDGEVVDDPAPAERVRKPAYHVRFQPFASPQLTKKEAAACGATKVGGLTHFTSEKQLNAHLANERRAGRDLRWKDHADGD